MREKWDSAGKFWRVANECVPLVCRIAKAYGYTDLDRRVQATFGVEDSRLHEYQRVAAAVGIKEQRWFFADEMGLGKSAEVITATRLLAATKVLVVCPAIVRYNWTSEFRKWWNDDTREVGIIHAGLVRSVGSKREKAALKRAYSSPFQVVSYNLLPKLTQKTGWDVIIFDECHRLKNPTATWTKVARELVLLNPGAHIYGLTATLMPDKPLDACGIVECICPGRFGGLNKAGELPFTLKGRYANANHNGYGWDFKGVNPLYVDELAERIRGLSSRTTKLEVAHLLPPFDVHYLEIRPGNPKEFRSIQQDLGTNFRQHTEKVDFALMRAGQEKITAAIEWAKDALESQTHVAICTHLKETARTIATGLESYTGGVFLVTGDTPPEKRNELLARARECPRAVIVSTMHSVGIGIDLTFCPSACLAELYYRPETVIQLLGRFSRLSGTVPSSVTIMVVKGSIDEAIAFALQAKIEALNTVLKGGLSESHLVEQLTGGEQDFLALAEQAAASFVADEYE